MRYAIAMGAALAAGAQASYMPGGYATSSTCTTTPTASPSASPSATPEEEGQYTTEVVTSYTTYCPSSGVYTHAERTYTVTEATTLTITNCPCTITKPVVPAPTTQAPPPPPPASRVAPPPPPPSAAPVAPPANITTPSAAPAPKAAPPESPVSSNEAATRQISVLTGAGLAMVAGLVALL